MLASRRLLQQPCTPTLDALHVTCQPPAMSIYGKTLSWQQLGILILFACLGASSAIVLPSTPCDTMSSPPLLETGFIPIADTHNASMFYWLVRNPSPSPKQPVGLWFHGFFYQHGPYRFVNNTLCYGFPHAWVDAGMSMVYIDSPLGTGFSYSLDDSDLARNETMVSSHIVRFLLALYERYPELVGRPLYLMGVSYAGHMIPNIASALLEASRAGAFAPALDLQGLSLGNPWLSPVHQYGAYAEFARRRGLLSDHAAANMSSEGVALCNVSLAACHDGGSRATCLNAWRVCQEATFDVIVRSNPGINVYDVTKRCLGPACYDYAALDTLFRQPGTRRLLKVPEGRLWTGICSRPAHEALMPDWPQDYQPLLGSLLDAGLRVLVYAGMDDLTCPWLGLQRALRAMPWKGQAAFAAAHPAELLVNGVVVGQEWRAGALAFVTVQDAGHEVPMDQPAVAQHLIARLIHNGFVHDPTAAM